MINIEKIKEQFPDLEVLQADGFDHAIIGLEPLSGKLIYDINKMIDVLLEEGLSEIDAIDHLEFNVINAYVGEQTPIYIHTID
tara:strand:- start:69 stop:317 length:249 start_codon:yes stop_codon:yes gene_type:complete